MFHLQWPIPGSQSIRRTHLSCRYAAASPSRARSLVASLPASNRRPVVSVRTRGRIERTRTDGRQIFLQLLLRRGKAADCYDGRPGHDRMRDSIAECCGDVRPHRRRIPTPCVTDRPNEARRTAKPSWPFRLSFVD